MASTSSMDEIIEGFSFFLEFDISTYVKETNDFPPIALLRGNLRNANLKFKDDDGQRTQLNTFFNLINEIFYETDDGGLLTQRATFARESLVRAIKNESSVAEMFPMAVSLGFVLGSLVKKLK